MTQTNYNLCGDYAGFAQAYVQEQQPGVQAMFMIGCGGDANPYPRSTMVDARNNGATLGQEVCRILKGKSQTAAYCNDVFGYFPSARVLKEGGYECRGLYTTTGFFAPAAQDVLVAKVRELAQRAGRKLPE